MSSGSRGWGRSGSSSTISKAQLIAPVGQTSSHRHPQSSISCGGQEDSSGHAKTSPSSPIWIAPQWQASTQSPQSVHSAAFNRGSVLSVLMSFMCKTSIPQSTRGVCDKSLSAHAQERASQNRGRTYSGRVHGQRSELLHSGPRARPLPYHKQTRLLGEAWSNESQRDVRSRCAQFLGTTGYLAAQAHPGATWEQESCVAGDLAQRVAPVLGNPSPAAGDSW